MAQFKLYHFKLSLEVFNLSSNWFSIQSYSRHLLPRYFTISYRKNCNTLEWTNWHIALAPVSDEHSGALKPGSVIVVQCFKALTEAKYHYKAFLAEFSWSFTYFNLLRFFSFFSDKENQESEFQMEGQSNPILKIYQNF